MFKKICRIVRLYKKSVFYFSAHGSNPGSNVLVADALITDIPFQSYDRTLNTQWWSLSSLFPER